MAQPSEPRPGSEPTVSAEELAAVMGAGYLADGPIGDAPGEGELFGDEPVGGQPAVGVPPSPRPSPKPEPAGRRATVNPVEFSPFTTAPTSETRQDIGLLLDIVLTMNVELGRTRMTVREVLGLGPGSVVELDKLAGEPVDVSINGTFIAKGEVVVVDEKFGVRITEIISPAKRLASV